MDKRDYYSLSSMRRREISIEDGDVNDQVMLCSKEFSVEVHFIASIDLKKMKKPVFTKEEGLLLSGIEIPAS